jgi:excisionase family DNA binding protein
MSADTRLLTVPEAARRLAVKESTIRAWLLARRLGKVKVGRRAVRILNTDIERLIAEGTIPARAERR